MYDTILVPSDGSEHAEKALDVALSLAAEHGATLHALFVVDTKLYGEPALSSVELVVNEIESEGDELLAEIRGRGREQDVETVVEARHGAPEEIIVEYADEIDADLIVMGNRGQTHRLHRGEVVETVVASTDRHVLVI